MSKRENIKRGVGLSTTLGTIFVVLKLLKLISWSWIWVLSPFWISYILLLVSVAILLAIAVFSKHT